MSGADDIFGRLADGIAGRVGDALVSQMQGGSGGARSSATNPGGGGDDDPDGYGYDNDPDVTDDEENAIVYDTSDLQLNIECACAAWRCRATVGDVVAYHEARKLAFFGDADELIDFCEHEDQCDPEEWMVLEINDVLEVDANEGELARLAGSDDNEDDLAGARENFSDFQQGNAARVDRIANIPGLDGSIALVQLGTANKIMYFAPKGGKATDYDHEFGEESGIRPTLYALGDKTLIIHGGNMHIEDRGIVD